MSVDQTAAVETAYELAAEWRCHPATVKRNAHALGIGVNLGGSAGWRFTAADKQALWDAMRAKPAKPAQATEEKPRQRRPRKRTSR